MLKENLSLDNEITELRPVQTDPNKPNWNPYPEFDEHCTNVVKGFKESDERYAKLKKENPIEYYKMITKAKWQVFKWKYNL